MRVLIVEDERKTASFLRRALAAEGFAVEALHEHNLQMAAKSGSSYRSVDDNTVIKRLMPSA